MLVIVPVFGLAVTITSIGDKAMAMAVNRGFHCIGSKRADQIAYSVLMCLVIEPWRRFWRMCPLSYGFGNLTERGDGVDLLFGALSAQAAQKKYAAGVFDTIGLVYE